MMIGVGAQKRETLGSFSFWQHAWYPREFPGFVHRTELDPDPIFGSGNVLCSWYYGEQVSPLESFLSTWNTGILGSSGGSSLWRMPWCSKLEWRTRRQSAQLSPWWWQEAASLLLIKGFKADLFLISQLQLMPHLRKLKIPPSTVNYVPVGHNCDFGYLLDHWRKTRPPSFNSWSLLKISPRKANSFPAGLSLNWNSPWMLPHAVLSNMSWFAVLWNAAILLDQCPRADEIMKLFATRQEDDQDVCQGTK